MANNNGLVALPALPKMSRGARPKTNDCACGCGQKTAANFVPGHDSRLRGWALRLERGLVTDKTFPGLPGELVAAKAFLKASGGHIEPHSRPSVVPAVPATTHDRKLGKKAARKAAKAKAELVEQAAETVEQPNA